MKGIDPYCVKMEDETVKEVEIVQGQLNVICMYPFSQLQTESIAQIQLMDIPGCLQYSYQNDLALSVYQCELCQNGYFLTAQKLC